MKLNFSISKSLIIGFLLHTFFSINLPGQNWFPLEIGNRRDYFYSYHCHGGSGNTDTTSVEVIADTVIMGKSYYILSRPFPFHDSKFLRIENDSLYCLETKDSVDCLIYAFDQNLYTNYYSCKYDTVFYFDRFYDSYFGYPDTQQVHGLTNESQICQFSKLFGLSFVGYFNPLCEYQISLSGCKISGITYGQLLVSVKNEKVNLLSFKLEQNYPNPFNPMTTIKYSIPNVGTGLSVNDWLSVTFKVYDILGNEVATLVNEQKQPGIYEIEFDANHLSSGTYFYTIIADRFVQTKKMILLK